MADTHVYYKELRFVIKDNLTECYVRMEAHTDVPVGVIGWHFKAFPLGTDVVSILNNMGIDSPLMWPLKSPE